MRTRRRVLGELLAVCLLAATLTAGRATAEPRITMSPATGVFAATQVVDFVAILEGLEGLGILGVRAELDKDDVTEPVLSCFQPEVLADALSYRCSGLPMGALGLGTHAFRITLDLTDGSQIAGGAIWEVLLVNP